ncbi:MAG: hypothetical protein EPO51_08355 [Phenylobacterium sp.]|uniref:hypothetical protein n=1 Tax=Phenylobacterium sp. TaxID=1871053 RepID=UPI00120DBE43|nr:hypothetical protein [Phenylobacterium sp.]TAJ72120.1 MAG: hypothetical protein EPO51_08355 [Phenylobacterium sp.]
MYDIRRLEDLTGGEAPFMMLLARPTPYDVEAMMRRADGLTYDAARQVNEGEGDPLSMGRSTCFRRSSTGVIFLDNDRSQDD